MTSVRSPREHVVDQPHRALLADRQRGQRVGIGDRLLERQHRQRRRQRLGGALADRRLDVVRLDDLDAAVVASTLTRTRRLDRDPAGDLPGERQLDPQDPVVVARAGALGDHVGAELDHPPERAGLDLDLLVDAALGLGAPAARR